MMTLPVPLHRARLMSFWLVLCVACAILFGGIAWSCCSLGWSAVVVVVMLGCAIIGLWSPRLIFRPYRLWNKLATILAYYARLWLMGICFYLVFVAVGQTGSSFPLGGPQTVSSRWVKRAPHVSSCARKGCWTDHRSLPASELGKRLLYLDNEDGKLVGAVFAALSFCPCSIRE